MLFLRRSAAGPQKPDPRGKTETRTLQSKCGWWGSCSLGTSSASTRVGPACGQVTRLWCDLQKRAKHAGRCTTAEDKVNPGTAWYHRVSCTYVDEVWICALATFFASLRCPTPSFLSASLRVFLRVLGRDGWVSGDATVHAAGVFDAPSAAQTFEETSWSDNVRGEAPSSHPSLWPDPATSVTAPRTAGGLARSLTDETSSL